MNPNVLTNAMQTEGLKAAGEGPGTLLHLMRQDARRNTEALPLPGIPDEAWRRVPKEAVEPLASALPVSGSLPSDEQVRESAVFTGEGDFFHNPGGEETLSKIEDFIGRWQSREGRRRERRLVRPNDVEENLAAALNLAYSPEIYLLEYGPNRSGQVQGGKLEINPRPALESREGKIALPLVFIHLQEDALAELEVVLHNSAGGPGQTILQIIYLLDKGADFSIRYGKVKKSEEDEPALKHLFTIERGYQEIGSRLKIGRISRPDGVAVSDSRYALLGKSARLEYYSIMQPGATGFAGQKSAVEHYARNTSSVVEARSVVEGGGSSLFVGTVKIPGGAAGSEANEQHRSLVLSEGARIESLPELEIVENDVKCGHAASVSEIGAEDIFYLQSRGIPTGEARRLLTDAFIQQIQSKMSLSGDREDKKK